MEKITKKAISSDYHFFPEKKKKFRFLRPGHLMVRTGGGEDRGCSPGQVGITWAMGLWSGKSFNVALGELRKKL